MQPPEGCFDCEDNRNKYWNDKRIHELFVLRQKNFARIISASDPWLAIAETSKLVHVVADSVLDIYVPNRKWLILFHDIIANYKECIDLVQDIIFFCENVHDGNLDWKVIIGGKENQEWLDNLTPELENWESGIQGAMTSASKIDTIVNIMSIGKRLETIIRGIYEHQPTLMARGYSGFNSPMFKALRFVGFLNDLIHIQDQAQKAAEEITTFFLSIKDLSVLHDDMNTAILEYSFIASQFGKYEQCCYKDCEPPLERDKIIVTKTVQSNDPNEMAGMSGFGDSATQRFVQPGEEMTYTIYFENKAGATAAAQEVRVTQELSKWLDWSTFQIAEIGFRNQIDRGLAGKSDGMSEVALEGTVWKVRTEVELNRKKGVMNCYLRIVDETTADGWPEDPYDGFLPPNDDNHSGEGYIRYKVKVREDAPVGVRIDAAATIVFDYNEPITTSPAWFNWIGTENGVQPETGCLTWNAVDGATYDVAIWTGEADAEERNVIATSGLLAENHWRLPSTLENDTVYFWQVKTTAADGAVTESPVWGFDLGGRCTFELRPGWNLLSLPFRPESYTERIMLGLNLFGADNGNYVRPDRLEAGSAYWLFQRGGTARYLDVFPSQTREEADIPLTTGWSMVGPTETERHLESGYTVWCWMNGRFCLVEEEAGGGYTLKAGTGYWVYEP